MIFINLFNTAGEPIAIFKSVQVEHNQIVSSNGYVIDTDYKNKEQYRFLSRYGNPFTSENIDVDLYVNKHAKIKKNSLFHMYIDDIRIRDEHNKYFNMLGDEYICVKKKE